MEQAQIEKEKMAWEWTMKCTKCGFSCKYTFEPKDQTFVPDAVGCIKGVDHVSDWKFSSTIN